MIKNILLHVSTYPDRTPDNVISASLAMARMLGSRLTAAICKVDLPDVSNRLVSMITDVEQIIATAERDEDTAAVELERQLIDAGKGGYPAVEIFKCTSTAVATASQLIGRARLSDLVIVATSQHSAQRALAQDLIFDCGKPVLLLPEQVAPEIKLNVIVVAWDGSRVAARAISDALPFLKFAQTVRLVEISGDKPLDGSSGIAALREQLMSHDVQALAETISADGGSAGDVLAAYCSRHHADLLVMGAFGHSRVRDFVLGGATKHFVTDPPLPILLSH